MNDILIVGTGALATLFAARLSQAGHSITMLGTWREGLEALRRRGARLVDADGQAHQFAVKAISNPRECHGIKHALVLVKSWQTERVARQLNECLAKDGLVVTLQNGLGNREILAQALDSSATHRPGGSVPGENTKTNREKNSRVALGVTTTGATLLAPGSARVGGEGTISIERHPALGPVEAALKSANFDVKIVEDAQSQVWGKLVINAAINPLTALLRVSNGELLERPSARAMMRTLATEAAQVAQAEKIRLPFSDPVAAAEEVALKTSANHSSMLQDVLRGAPTEIDAICGAVVQIAEKHNMPAPANWSCWKLVKALTE